MNKKLLMVIAFILIGVISITGITYAIYTWAMSEQISGTTECFDINYIKGQDISGRTLQPSNDYTGGIAASVIVSTDSTCSITNGVGTLYLTTDESTSDILLTSGVLKYQIVENSLTLLESGTISNTGEMLIGENIEVISSPKQLSIFVWLDGSLINDDNVEEILASSYSGSISMSVESGDL